jgi:hypothetical protein
MFEEFGIRFEKKLLLPGKFMKNLIENNMGKLSQKIHLQALFIEVIRRRI